MIERIVKYLLLYIPIYWLWRQKLVYPPPPPKAKMFVRQLSILYFGQLNFWILHLFSHIFSQFNVNKVICSISEGHFRPLRKRQSPTVIHLKQHYGIICFHIQDIEDYCLFCFSAMSDSHKVRVRPYPYLLFNVCRFIQTIVIETRPINSKPFITWL